MNRMKSCGMITMLVALAAAPPLLGQPGAAPAANPQAVAQPSPAPPATPQLYVVGTAHLDTQWRWTVRDAIEQMLPATLHQNFDLFDKYPDYVFSFEGAFRYMLMNEYYPKEFERLRQEIADGRWRVAGSWVDAVDTNMPSPESLMRHVLYGNGYFRREFGVTSKDVFLPDCFGFGYALPSIAAHCGLTGFSSQKLTWGSAVGVPFDIGIWEGVDGSTLIAALNPGEYVARIGSDLSADSAIVATASRQGETSGVFAAFKYFGTGDQGGSPTDESVAWLEKSIHGSGPVRVRSVASDQLARDLSLLTAEQRSRLPHYKGELLMTDHGAGCYTSQAAMKWWNRKNERLADAAERASVIAHWLGGAVYPRENLHEAWIRFLWHQFHDDLTGTSIPEAYVYSWNDEAISHNQFGGILTDAVGAVARALDTRVRGIPVVVYNPLSIDRRDPVDAVVRFEAGAPAAVRVFGPDGAEVPSQFRRVSDREMGVCFLAAVPSVGFCVFDVRPAERGCDLPGARAGAARAASEGYRAGIENGRYRVAVDANGDIASIVDKIQGRELLSSPLRLQMIADEPYDWPAWEVDYDDLMAKPREEVAGPARVEIEENGPARAALRIERRCAGSTFRQIVRLSDGEAGDRIEVETLIDWNSPGTLLKAAFPFAVRNGTATYDLGLGTIQRGINHKALYEVPAQQWADITAADGSYGVAILNDSRYGWDKPDDHTLRLSLVRTPAVNARWKWVQDQESMDLGSHRLTYAICGHAGSWARGRVAWEADRLNQPLIAFQTPSRKGALGRSFSLLRVSSPDVAVRAVKMAEESDEIVVRLQETAESRHEGVRLTCARPVTSVREVNGAEEAVARSGKADGFALSGGALTVDLLPYRPRTFAIRLGLPPATVSRSVTKSVILPHNMVGITQCGAITNARFDDEGRTLPGELLPERLVCAGIPFQTGPRGAGQANVLACRGQTIPIPAGGFDRLYFVAASVGGDREGTFSVDGRATRISIQDYDEPIGQWDCRLNGGAFHEKPDEIVPGYVKEDPVAWVGTHRHTRDGKTEAYSFAHFFKYGIDLPKGARSLRLPNDDRIRLLAMAVVRGGNDATLLAAAPRGDSRATVVHIRADELEFLDSTRVVMSTPSEGAVIRYTLDGSDPIPGSKLYEGPVTLNSSATVKARAFRAGMDERYIGSVTVKRLVFLEPATIGGTAGGLACLYYEGEWSKLPDFDVLQPARAEVLPQVSIPAFARPERTGLKFTGYLRIPSDGLYTLHLWSDDGSALALHGQRVIDNDGLHGRGDVTAKLALKAGLHPIEVEFFQRGGDSALELDWEGPGIALQEVPETVLSH